MLVNFFVTFKEMSENPLPAVSKCSIDNLGIMKLNDNKAGMQGLDTAKINQII